MKFYIVDCFSEKKYHGNQLAVFFPDYSIKTEEMQKIAKEIGFSETTFVLSSKKINNGYNIRIFTPDVEVPFAGHPSLGTAYVIWKIIENENSKKVILNLRIGQVPVKICHNIVIINNNQPIFGKIFNVSSIINALSLDKDDIKNELNIQLVSTGLESIIVPLRTIKSIEKCKVNYYEFQKFIDNYYKCNILVFIQEKNYIRVRVFMDDTGFLEDPATGSANSNLAAYLLYYNYFNSNKINYNVIQGLEMGRPSKLEIFAKVENNIYTINIGGSANIIASGEWYN